MHRLASIILVLLMLQALPAASAPVSSIIGRVQVSIKPGSISETVLNAINEPFTDEWLEKYADSSLLFASAAAPLLQCLPLSNAIIGEERKGSVAVLSQDTGTVLSFSFREGRIVSVYPGT